MTFNAFFLAGYIKFDMVMCLGPTVFLQVVMYMQNNLDSQLLHLYVLFRTSLILDPFAPVTHSHSPTRALVKAGTGFFDKAHKCCSNSSQRRWMEMRS